MSTATAYANTITLVATIADHEEGRINVRRLDGYVASAGDLVLPLDGLGEVEQKSAFIHALVEIAHAEWAAPDSRPWWSWTITWHDGEEIGVDETDAREILGDDF